MSVKVDRESIKRCHLEVFLIIRVASTIEIIVNVVPIPLILSAYFTLPRGANRMHFLSEGHTRVIIIS